MSSVTNRTNAEPNPPIPDQTGRSGRGSARGTQAPSSPPPASDSSTPADRNRVYDLMMSTIENHGQGEVRGWHAWMTVGSFENMVEWAGDVGELDPAAANRMVDGLLDFARQFPDSEEGYIVSAALLSSLSQAIERNPELAANLSRENRHRLADLALQLDAAAPGRLRDLLGRADNMENFRRGPTARPVSEWNDQVNAGDVDFAKGAFSQHASATEGLQAILGDSFVAATTTEEAAETIRTAYTALPTDARGSLLEQIMAEAAEDPLFAVILAIIQAAEDTQENAAQVLTDEGFTLDEQGLAAVQHQIQKAGKLLEMGMGILDSLHQSQDTVGRGWS